MMSSLAAYDLVATYAATSVDGNRLGDQGPGFRQADYPPFLQPCWMAVAHALVQLIGTMTAMRQNFSQSWRRYCPGVRVRQKVPGCPPTSPCWAKLVEIHLPHTQSPPESMELRIQDCLQRQNGYFTHCPLEDVEMIFTCNQAALRTLLSVCPSVCHTFFTMFLSSYHHEIFRSNYQWQKWYPWKRSRSEVKGQGHRGQNPV